MTGLFDSFHRRINYMRISVTDHCNLRCSYCTADLVPRLAHDDILRYEEIHTVVRAAASLGVKKIRLTGGEPLVRPDLSRLVRLISRVEGVDEISLTTNAILLDRYAAELKAAGLKRVNISLDTFKADKFERITGSDRLKDVLSGIETATKVGLDPVKINMVVLKGINDDELLNSARMSISEGWHVRFIEHMPLTSSAVEDNGLVAVQDMMRIIQESLGPLEPCGPLSGNGPAKYYRLPRASGTLGFIGPVTDCFCTGCNRFRLTADGRLRPCLLDDTEVDIKGPLRGGASTQQLAELMWQAATLKREQHRLGENFVPSKRQMWQIGG
ncbi:MAG: GTP 3',8-cyclase MoaA [Dehalococcoidales bacterium]